MAATVMSPEGRQLDIDYFLEWRPYLWRRPMLWAMGNLGWLAGKRVLEVGCRYGKMSCFFGLMGADALGVDTDARAIARAKDEAVKWGVTDRVTFLHVGGDPAELKPRTFDLIFTKSVLYWVQDLERMLDKLDELLAAGGHVAFVENWRGSDFMMTLRRWFVHRRWLKQARDWPGIRASQLPLFQERFDEFEYKRYWHLVIAMKGRKKATAR